MSPMQDLNQSILTVLRGAGGVIPQQRLQLRCENRTSTPLARKIAASFTEQACVGLLAKGRIVPRMIVDADAGELRWGWALPGCEGRPETGSRDVVVALDVDDPAEMDRWRSAVHESSHVTCALALGGVCTVIELHEQGGADGRFRVGLPKVDGKRPLDAEACVFFAGAEGERRYCGDSPGVAEGARDDERQAKATGLPPVRLQQLREQAAAIVGKHGTIILSLAAELFQKRNPTLYGSRVHKLVEQAARNARR